MGHVHLPLTTLLGRSLARGRGLLYPALAHRLGEIVAKVMYRMYV